VRRGLLAAGVACVLAGCGGGAGDLRVSAAASLRLAFTRYAHEFEPPRVRLAFAGSDALAAQIEQGLRPDVFASANTVLQRRLRREGLVEAPVVFASNRLVLAVPRGSSITGLASLEHPGVSVAVGAAGVPVGAYTATVLGRLPAAERALIEANVRDREPDVTGIVGKLAAGAVDAGFLYATDVAASAGRIRAIALPPALEPQVAYGAAVVRGSSHRAAAERFLAGLLSGAGRAELLHAGFLPAPAR
jgi:molybdate transport system substrate-binding protein